MSTGTKPGDNRSAGTDPEPGTKEWFLGLPHSAQEALGTAYARSLGLKVIRSNKQDDPVYIDPDAPPRKSGGDQRET